MHVNLARRKTSACVSRHLFFLARFNEQTVCEADKRVPEGTRLRVKDLNKTVCEADKRVPEGTRLRVRVRLKPSSREVDR